MSASCSKVRSSTKAIPSVAVISTATCGVRKRGCTAATCRKNSPSSAMAKKIRGPVSSDPFTDPKVERITVSDTSVTPTGPTSRCATSAATSRAPRISSMESTLR
jgi:hypothetical protein